MAEKSELVWAITNHKEEGIEIKFGKELSEMPIEDSDKLRALGKILINLGTRLMTADTEDDDEDWGDED